MKKNLKKIMVILLSICILMGFLLAPNMEMVKAEGRIALSGRVHVQTFADQNGKVVNQGGIETLVLGTRGLGKRLESIIINLNNNTGYEGALQYRVHVQTYGWTEWRNAGQPAGTTGQGKRLEGIQMRLTGELAEHYDVRYCAHIQTYGDSQGWVYNGALAGTTGEAKRLEEIKVQIVPKSSVSTTPSVSYRVHRQTYGWEKRWSINGDVSGTTGEAKRLEGITITVNDNQYSGGVTYRTHVQSYGWMSWVSNGEMSGTQGQAKRLEAIQIKLTGDLANYYDIYYQVHVQSYGWTDWVKNGVSAGTMGQAKRLEAIRILLVTKNGTPPQNMWGSGTNGENNGCQHEWTPNMVHFDAVTRTDFLPSYRDVFPHSFCNGCGSDTQILNDDPYDCPYCESSGWHGIFSATTKEPYISVKEVTERPEYNLVESYECKKCGLVVENESEKARIKELREQGHVHSWTPVYGESHDSMVLRGSANDIFWSDECAKCGMSLATFFQTTTLQTYKSNLDEWCTEFKYAHKENHPYKTAGTPGLNEAAIDHLKNCFGMDKLVMYSYDEVIGFKCKTCGQTKACDDKDIECTMAENYIYKEIEYWKNAIIESGDTLPIDYSQITRESGYELHNGNVYYYKTLKGNKEYTRKFVNGQEDWNYSLNVSSNTSTGIGKLKRGNEIIYTFRYDPYKWGEQAENASLETAVNVPSSDIIEEYFRYVHVGDLIYKYEVTDGELGQLLQIYDQYFEPIN
ncbi:MAG: hypothetical protein ACI4L2_06445 [Wujia sp.]